MAESAELATLLLLNELLGSDDEKPTRGPTRDWVKRRREKGYFNNIVKELRLEDRVFWFLLNSFSLFIPKHISILNDIFLTFTGRHRDFCSNSIYYSINLIFIRSLLCILCHSNNRTRKTFEKHSILCVLHSTQ